MRLANNSVSAEATMEGNYTRDARDARQELNYNMTMAVLPVTVFIGVECCVGLVGNILILLIYSLHYGRSTFRCLILSMALIDVTSCLTSLPAEIVSQLIWYSYEYVWICKIKSFFNVLNAFSSAEILFILAFDRYRKVCRPLAWQIRPSTAVRLCVGSVVIAAVVASPALVLWGIQDYMYVDGSLRINVSICEKSSQYADEIYPFLYVAFIYILPVGVMMLIICCLNILTTKTLFCGIRDLSKMHIQKTASVSTIASAVSFNQKLTSEANVNIRSTDIDIWVGTSSQNDNIRFEDITIAFNTEQCSTSKSIHNDLVRISNNNGKVMKIDTVIGSSSDQANSTETELSDPDAESETDQKLIPKVDYTGDTHGENPVSVDVKENQTGINKGREIVKTSLSLSDTSISTYESRGSSRRFEPLRSSETSEQRRKRKTLIMLVLTSVFVVTMMTYIVMTSVVADSDGALRVLSNSGKTAFFLFWRMYFINCVVNPVLYGFVDPRFRSGLRDLMSGKRRVKCCH